MDEVKTPYDLWVELKDMVADLEKDAIKATRGMKAGGVRLRSDLQSVREHCQEMRKAVLDFRSTPRSKSSEGEAVGENTTDATTVPSVANEHNDGYFASTSNGDSAPAYESHEAMAGLNGFAAVNRAV